jgi:hypothetical protein
MLVLVDVDVVPLVVWENPREAAANANASKTILLFIIPSLEYESWGGGGNFFRIAAPTRKLL